MFYIPNKLLRVFLSFLLLFTLHRVLFVIYHFKACNKLRFPLLLRSFYEALPLDISTACYLGLIPFLLILLYYLFNKKILLVILKIYLCFFVFITTIIAVADIIVYKEMNVKIHFKLLYHLKHPAEVFQSASTPVFLAGWLFIFVFTLLFCKLMFRITRLDAPHNRPVLQKIAISIVSLAVLGFMIVMGARGGLQQIPINESQVYFSTYHVLDDAAVNPTWTLVHSYIENIKAGNKNPYVFMPQQKANALIKEMYAASDSSFDQFITTTRPNIVYVILESWTADAVEKCGGDKGITPRFDQLAKDGLLFANAYASGQLSHQGIPAILSSYPSQPITAIIQNSDKYPHIPCINRELTKYGYNSSFYFGGQLIYGNLRSYLFYNQFNEIKEQADFSVTKNLKSKLGIHDEYMFNKWLEGLNKKKEPFLSCLFTVSTHSPYIVPMKDIITYGNLEQKYLNSVYYSDSCLGDFFSKAKQQPWYKNTLFIIVSDHSHPSPRGVDPSMPDRNHIPLLFYGDVIKEEYRGRIIDRITSQTDITATLLDQMKIPHHQFNWSKNLFDTAHVFAYYSFYNGYGLVTPKGSLVWDKRAGGIYTLNTFKTADSVACRQKGEAYLQKLFQEYLNL